MLDDVTSIGPLPNDPFRTSMLARPAWVRVLVVAVGLVPLWLAIAWAVSVP